MKVSSSFAVSLTRNIALIRFCTWVGVYQVVIFSYMFSHLCVFFRPSVYCAATGTSGMMIVLALFSLGHGNNRKAYIKVLRFIIYLPMIHVWNA